MDNPEFASLSILSDPHLELSPSLISPISSPEHFSFPLPPDSPPELPPLPPSEDFTLHEWAHFLVMHFELMLEANNQAKLNNEHHIRTGCGSMTIIVYGDQDKPALIIYPDLDLTLGAAAIGSDAPAPFAEDLANQIIENFNYFSVYADFFIFFAFFFERKNSLDGLSGVCGYGSLALGLSGGHLAAAMVPNSGNGKWDSWFKPIHEQFEELVIEDDQNKEAKEKKRKRKEKVQENSNDNDNDDSVDDVYQRDDSNLVMRMPNKEHRAEDIIGKMGERPMLKSDIDAGIFDGLPIKLKPLDKIM
ncbi:Pollen-specific protein SF21 [Senna tora]|uniref:Pollen-specific protein SF21 n=1 Tax=Senna tora TaxID=362788 RepID=A0A834TLE8_9FABA|nr:Pollen-specific protein SF21 [Senna tora]